MQNPLAEINLQLHHILNDLAALSGTAAIDDKKLGFTRATIQTLPS